MLSPKLDVGQINCQQQNRPAALHLINNIIIYECDVLRPTPAVLLPSPRCLTILPGDSPYASDGATNRKRVSTKVRVERDEQWPDSAVTGSGENR